MKLADALKEATNGTVVWSCPKTSRDSGSVLHRFTAERAKITEDRVAILGRAWDRHSGKRITPYYPGMDTKVLVAYKLDEGLWFILEPAMFALYNETSPESTP